MKILVTGQTSVHMGRLENGNIGNYYITETTFRELHRVFPNSQIVTTLQMSDNFCKKENVQVLPMSLFYNWTDEDLSIAIKELGIAELFKRTKKIWETTPYIEAVRSADLVLDFSGELWGDHANPVGENRFLIGLLKMRVAQLFGCKTALIASSEGPFSDPKIIPFAKEVFENFNIVSNREPESVNLLKEYGFQTEKVHSFACPAFLFEPYSNLKIAETIQREGIVNSSKKTVGFILCGFNMLEGPYDKTPRRDDEFFRFAEIVEYITNDLGLRVVLLSHQNGFEIEPTFKLINGRDYPIIKQLHTVVKKRGIANMDDVHCIERPYNPWETKAIIGNFDMFVTGRVHGFAASTSQCVPTVLITRGFGPVSHRNIGFARSVGMEDYIADPRSVDDMKNKILSCWKDRDLIKNKLTIEMPKVKENARNGFNILRTIF